MERRTRMYGLAMTLSRPAVSAWGPTRVEGLESLPARGPPLVVGNHDSQWDR